MKTKTIAIIEDNLRNLKLFKEILKVIPDLYILEETSGDHGLELLKTRDVDLIVLDILLPKISGIDICRELRKLEIHQKTPIIAITSFAMPGDKERIMEAGFTTYLSKPIKAAEFRELIRNYLLDEIMV